MKVYTETFKNVNLNLRSERTIMVNLFEYFSPNVGQFGFFFPSV